MSIPAKTSWDPLEFVMKFRDIIIFAQIKYKIDNKILRALKVIKFRLSMVKIAEISIIDEWQKQKLYKLLSMTSPKYLT